MSKQLYIVGMYRQGHESWEFVGVFDTEPKAAAACLDTRYFVGPAKLNEVTPKRRMRWKGCFYPHTDSAVTAKKLARKRYAKGRR